jgi:hypothetical protein
MIRYPMVRAVGAGIAAAWPVLISLFTLFKRRSAGGNGALGNASEQTSDVEPGATDRAMLRRKHAVTLVSEADEGFGADRQSAGVYGFSYAPALASAPLFRRRTYQSFEVHKLQDGSVVIVGFVPEQVARQIEEGREALRFRLLPEPREDAAAAVAIPHWRIARSRDHSARDGKGLELQLRPIQ